MLDLEKTVQDILEVCPPDLTGPDIAVIIANIVAAYNSERIWPLVSEMAGAFLYEEIDKQKMH